MVKSKHILRKVMKKKRLFTITASTQHCIRQGSKKKEIKYFKMRKDEIKFLLFTNNMIAQKLQETIKKLLEF